MRRQHSTCPDMPFHPRLRWQWCRAHQLHSCTPGLPPGSCHTAPGPRFGADACPPRAPAVRPTHARSGRTQPSVNPYRSRLRLMRWRAMHRTAARPRCGAVALHAHRPPAYSSPPCRTCFIAAYRTWQQVRQWARQLGTCAIGGCTRRRVRTPNIQLDACDLLTPRLAARASARFSASAGSAGKHGHKAGDCQPS